LSSDRPGPSLATTDTIVSLLSTPPPTGWQRDVCPNLPQQRDISQGLGRTVRGRTRKRYTLKGMEMCSHAWTSFAYRAEERGEKEEGSRYCVRKDRAQEEGRVEFREGQAGIVLAL
jgi:hypothetical protein